MNEPGRGLSVDRCQHVDPEKGQCWIEDAPHPVHVYTGDEFPASGRILTGPRYRTMVPPFGPGVWWTCCNECGTCVLDVPAHDRWHESLSAPARTSS